MCQKVFDCAISVKNADTKTSNGCAVTAAATYMCVVWVCVCLSVWGVCMVYCVLSVYVCVCAACVRFFLHRETNLKRL